MDTLKNGTTEAAPLFLVVTNDEEQYSLWEAARPVPAGWYPQGGAAPREECLERIERLWTDMRPLSLR
ncbi:MbtH family protein [Streptomyces sp. NPDC097619]|uniref:MbtH family protein n=1 Tax=Streptomyces sp. NPDC097619 TaxID=3157228 RepID=UPI0033185ED4